ncbi:MAG: aspartyl protease family protein [Candidatus Krumholzibacteriia bacterium]
MKTLLAALCAAVIATSVQATTIPFTLESGLITVPVDVGGHTLPLMLDLGDFRAISLTSGVLDSVAVDFTGEHDSFTNFAGDLLQARRFIAHDVRLGGLHYGDLDGSEDVSDPNNPSPNPYGAIGRSFFEGRRLTIDYRTSTLTMDDEPLVQAIRLPLDTAGGMMRVQATVDGKPLTLLVDTGAQVSMLAPSHFEENTRFQDSHSAYRAQSLTVAGHDLGTVLFLRMELGVPDFDGIIGSDVLGRYRTQVDLGDGCLRLQEQAR